MGKKVQDLNENVDSLKHKLRGHNKQRLEARNAKRQTFLVSKRSTNEDFVNERNRAAFLC